MKRLEHLRSGLIVIFSGFVLILLSFATQLTAGIGANIGGGLLFLLGCIVLLTGLVTIFIKAKSLLLKIVAALSFAVFIAFNIQAFKAAEDESNRIYCEEKIAANEMPVEGPNFCLEYE